MSQTDNNDDHKLVEDRDYVFCPWCAAKLIESHLDYKDRKRCPDCDFIDYKNPTPAAGGIVINNGKILLVKRKYPPYVGDWCFPAGFMEYGESPAVCCSREVKEETGLVTKPTDTFKIYSGKDDPRTRAVLILYLVEVVGGKLKPGDDASEAVYFDIENTPKNIAFESHQRAIDDYKYYLKNGRMPDPNE